LTVSHEFAVAPSDISVLLSNLGALAIKKVEFDATGSGQFDDITALGPSLSVSYTAPALHIATIRVTTQDDHTYTARAAIAIVGGQAMYQRVKGIIGGMLGKLQAGDVASALNRITPDVAPTFQDVFNSLAQAGSLGASAAQFGNITEVSVGADIVEALLQRATASGTEAYWLYLMRGSDGIWRIDSM
jgi:hypothetical protein